MHEMTVPRREAFRRIRRLSDSTSMRIDAVMTRTMALALQRLGWIKIEKGSPGLSMYHGGKPARFSLTEIGKWILEGAQHEDWSPLQMVRIQMAQR
jgi:hypothetical protein